MKFDEAGAYKQTAMAHEAMWMQCMFWNGQFVADDRLLYGGAFAPQCYGGRWAALRRALFMKFLRRRLELDAVDEPGLHEWITFREKHVGEGQGYPVWMSIYIDDLVLIAQFYKESIE